MIVGLGTDLVRIERFGHWTESMLARFFDPDEIAYCNEKTDSRLSSIAARFAAKEAFGKALGTGLRNLRLKDIAVCRDDLGKPFIELREGAKTKFFANGNLTIHLSLSHDKDYAMATVIIEKREAT